MESGLPNPDETNRVRLAAVHTRLNSLADRLEALSKWPSHPAELSPQDRDLASAVQRLETKLDRIATPQPAVPPAAQLAPAPTDSFDTAEPYPASEDPVAAVDRILTSLNAGSPPAASAGWSGDLDDAIEQITARQRELDVPSARAGYRRPNGLEEHVAKLTHELETLRRPGGFAETIQSLRYELADIRTALTAAAPRETMRRLQEGVSDLTQRLDELRQSGSDPQRLEVIEDRLASLQRILDTLAPAESLTGFRDEVRAIDHKLDQVATERDGTELQRLQHEVAELRNVAAHAASSEAIVALAEELQRIGERIEASSAFKTNGLMSGLDERLHALTEQLERHAPTGEGLPSHASAEISAIVGSLAEKLERADLSPGPMLEAINTHLSQLSERIEASDSRLSNLDTLERGLGAILDELENLRISAMTTAERVAEEAVSRLGHPGAGFAPADVEAIKNDIEGLRHLQSQSDRRTQDTLEQVHDTLVRLVERVAALDGQSAAVPASIASPSFADLPLTPVLSSMAPLVPSQERRPIDPTLPADHPLEPGSAARAKLSPAERIAASEAALPPGRAAPKGDARANFIAAARRAAQAAQTVSAGAPDVYADEPKSGRSLASAMQKLTRRRPLMLGLAILVLAGALHVVLNVRGQQDAALTKPLPTSEALREKPKVSVAKAPAETTPFSTAALPTAPQKPADEAPAAPTAANKDSADVAASTAALVAAPPAATPAAAPQTASVPATATTAPASQQARMIPGVSPLAIASATMPAASDVTGSIGRPTATTRAAPVDSSITANLPASFSAGLKSAAAAGNAAAAYEIAMRFAEGRGAPSSLEEAARWFERAAAQGLAPAQYRIGAMYEKGQGVKKDLEQARRMYRSAADRGNGKSMHNLAVLHAEGIDGKPDLAMAAQWFRKAAKRGVSDSQYNLGILYARGLGVDQNLAESYKWFALAALGGDQDAGRKRDDVAARLDQSALAAAKTVVEGFKPEPQPDEAINVAAPAGGWDAPVATAPAKGKTAEKPRRILAR